MMSSIVLLLALAQVTDWTAEERRLASTFTPVPAAPKSTTNRFADNPNAAAVGVRLFHDERLSANGKISCAHCWRQRRVAHRRTMHAGVGEPARRVGRRRRAEAHPCTAAAEHGERTIVATREFEAARADGLHRH